MINLLRGEIYKLFRSKCLYIFGAFMVAFVLLIYGMFSLADMMMQGDVENGSYGISVSTEETQGAVSVWDDMDIPAIVQVMFSSVGSIIVAIFASIYFWGEYANGAIKNVVGKGYGRWTVFTSKYISTVVGVVVIEIMVIPTVLICETLILGARRIDTDILANLAGYMGMQILFAAALTAIIVTIGQICRNLGAGIAISVCVIMFSSFVTTGLNALFSYAGMNADVCDYWILDLISECPVTGMDGSFLIRAIVCAVVWLVLAHGAGSLHFGKADVK